MHSLIHPRKSVRSYSSRSGERKTLCFANTRKVVLFLGLHSIHCLQYKICVTFVLQATNAAKDLAGNKCETTREPLQTSRLIIEVYFSIPSSIHCTYTCIRVLVRWIEERDWGRSIIINQRRKNGGGLVDWVALSHLHFFLDVEMSILLFFYEAAKPQTCGLSPSGDRFNWSGNEARSFSHLGCADGGASGHWKDSAGQGCSHRVWDHVLQCLLLHPHLQVPWRVGEAYQDSLWNGT